MSEEKSGKILVDPDVARLADRYILLVGELQKLNLERHNTGRTEFEVCLDAVVAIKRFLDADQLVMAWELTRPFGALALALRDLGLGGRPELFSRAKVKSRPAGASNTVMIQATAAAGLQLLHHYGESLEIAATFVVRELKKVGIEETASKDIINEGTIRGWRDEMGGRITGAAQDIYNQIIQNVLAGLPPGTPTSRVRKVVVASISALRAEGARGRKSE